jgi:dolichol kinase
VLFPLAVFISFWAFQAKGNSLLYFYLPVLTLAVCDLAAALTGQKFPLRNFQIFASTKSLGGCLSFMVTSLILNLLMLVVGFHLSVAAIILIPLITAAVECATPKGFDNLSIPATVIVLLHIFQL